MIVTIDCQDALKRSVIANNKNKKSCANFRFEASHADIVYWNIWHFFMTHICVLDVHYSVYLFLSSVAQYIRDISQISFLESTFPTGFGAVGYEWNPLRLTDAKFDEKHNYLFLTHIARSVYVFVVVNIINILVVVVKLIIIFSKKGNILKKKTFGGAFWLHWYHLLEFPFFPIIEGTSSP